MVAHSGYQCLLLELDGCDVQRRLYVKQHEHSETQSENSGALFVAGIPVKLENCLDEVFGAFGDVEQVWHWHIRGNNATAGRVSTL